MKVEGTAQRLKQAFVCRQTVSHDMHMVRASTYGLSLIALSSPPPPTWKSKQGEEWEGNSLDEGGNRQNWLSLALCRSYFNVKLGSSVQQRCFISTLGYSFEINVATVLARRIATLLTVNKSNYFSHMSGKT